MAIDYQAQNDQLRQQLLSVREELAALKSAQEGDLPAAYSRLQGKIDRQSKALDTLNRKVTSQRFRLRTIQEAGRDLTKEEYDAAKAKLEADNPAITGRVEEFATV